MALEKKEKKPVICAQGKTFTLPGRFRDRFGNLIDLTGYSASVQIRTGLPDPADPTAGLQLSISSDEDSEFGKVEVDVDSGIVTVTINATRTANFLVGSYLWELELKGPSGYVPYFMPPSKFKVEAEANV